MPTIDQLVRELKLDKTELLGICAKLNISGKKNGVTNSEASAARQK